MFTDIVTSTDLVGLIGDDAWGDLLGWHDRELRSAFANHRGEEVKRPATGSSSRSSEPTDGLDCAVDIQRRLARHRRDHGFAPTVRIGLHAAEATCERGDYQGGGVHVAARSARPRCGGEILVSSATLGEIGLRPIRAVRGAPGRP